jgi:hypothetical protein
MLVTKSDLIKYSKKKGKENSIKKVKKCTGEIRKQLEKDSPLKIYFRGC